jgi:eukaryotic-like serine/threonine-protein kinase
MTPGRFLRVEEIFHSALAQPINQRSAFLLSACGDDDVLRREVELLLEYREQTRDPLQVPGVDDALRALAEGDAESLVGRTLGHYQIIRRIGAGGMGEVYAAQDLQLNRRVALKLLTSYLTRDEEQVNRLHREAQTASALNHPNIVTIYELGHADSLHYIAMEFVEGETLRQKISASLPLHEILNIAIQVASGLAAAHQAGILHRDIKPENVMFGKDGFVKILDFGIAKFTQQQRPVAPLLRANPDMSVAAGTLSYMSPEQAQGHSLDARTDIFSLGVVLFEMIIGKRPFDRATQPDRREALLDNNEAPPMNTLRKDVPINLERIVAKALRKNRDHRYTSTRELLTDLREFDSGAGEGLGDAQRANRMLQQYLSIYAVDKRALIPIRRLSFIRSHSDLESGALTRELFRKSLRLGVIKISLLFASLLLVGAVAAFAFSRSEEWTGTRFSDGHTRAVRRAIFSPDGRRLLSVGEDKKIIVWDFAQRKRIATLADHTDWVTRIAFSPDGKWLATGSRDKTIIVWDADTLQRITVLREHHGEVRAVGFSPDSRVMASASYDPDVRTILWGVGRWERVAEIPEGSGYSNLVFSPDSKFLITAANQWEVNTGTRARRGAERFQGNWRAEAPDRETLVCATADGWVNFWDVKQFWRTGQLRLLQRYRAHHDDARAAAFSPNGRLLATGADDIILWDAKSRALITHFKYPSIVWSVEFSPDGNWLISTHGDGSILLWNVEDRQLAGNLNEHSGPVRSVAYSSDGTHIASASEDGTVLIWNADGTSKETTLIGHDARAMAVGFSPDRKWIASMDFYRNLIRWDLDRGQPRWTVNTHLPGRMLAISPDSRWIAVSAGVFSAEDGRQVFDFGQTKPELQEIYGVAFSTDGRWLGCAGANGQLSLVDVRGWRLVECLDVKESQLIAVSFSPDSKSLITGDDEGRVRLWSLNPLHEVALIGRHSARVKSVTFSPDGSEVASAGDDRNICLWDIATRRLITSIGTHTAPVLSIAFSPDGRKLVAGGHDNSVRLFTRHSTVWGYRWN